jgi:hypothetical protein
VTTRLQRRHGVAKPRITRGIAISDHICDRTIYVLCRYFESSDTCSLIGWQWGRVLLTTTPKDYGKGVMNYWWPGNQLRSISELEERV